MSGFTTYYDVLEIAETATEKEIKAAYRRLCKEYHPDGIPSHRAGVIRAAEEKLQQLNEAYEVLSNPEKRKQYDARLRELRSEEQGDASGACPPSSGGAPILKLSKTNFDFQNIRKDSHVYESFTISNAGGGVLSGRIQSNKRWLSLSQDYIDATKQRQDVHFTIDTTGLSPGAKESCLIEVQSNGGMESVVVHLSMEVPETKMWRMGLMGESKLLLTVLVFLLLFVLIRSCEKDKEVKQKTTYTEGYWGNDGKWVEPQKMGIGPKLKKPSQRTEYRGGADIKMVINCDAPLLITMLNPGEKIQARHVYFGRERAKENRCSYDAEGNVHHPEDPKMDTQDAFRADLPFPKEKVGQVVIYMVDRITREIIVFNSIKKPGRVIHLCNTAIHEAEVWMEYNYMKFISSTKGGKEQIGHDGSTYTAVFTKYQDNTPCE